MKQATDVAREPEDSGMTVDEAWKAIEVVTKALGFRDFIKEGLFGPALAALPLESQLEESMSPRISIFYPDEDKKIPSIFFRVIGNEGPLAEAYFYPFEAAWSFIEEARQALARIRPAEWSDDEFEKRTQDGAVEMMLIMIDNLYIRSKLMMDSFTMETIAQWHANRDRKIHHYFAEQGKNLPRPKVTFLDSVIKDYGGELKQLWRFQGQSQDNWRKILLAEEYESLKRHWGWIYKIMNEDGSDWMEYAKAGEKYADTPDDLLKKLELIDRSTAETTNNRLSEIVLEHAARRAGLIKKSGVSDRAQRKRKEGVLVSDYSSPQLFNFLREGRELQIRVEENKKIHERLGTYPTADQTVSDPALTKKQKSLEQKLNFVKGKSKNSSEQNDDSAIKKKK